MSGQGLPGGGDRGPWVYFIQAGEGGPIKIGFTSGNPHARMANLQIGNAATLRMLGAGLGSFEDEQTIHEQFSHLLIRGEWFRPEDGLRGFIMGFCWHRPRPPLLKHDEPLLPCGLSVVDLWDIEEYLACRELVQQARGWLDSDIPPTDFAPVERLITRIEQCVRGAGYGADMVGRTDLITLALDLGELISTTAEGVRR